MNKPVIKVYTHEHGSYSSVTDNGKEYIFADYTASSDSDKWRAALHATKFVKENFENVDNSFKIEIIYSYPPDNEDIDDVIEDDYQEESEIVTIGDVLKENCITYSKDESNSDQHDFSKNYYAVYQNLGGKMSYTNYIKHLKVFKLLIVNTFVFGEEVTDMDREEAIEAFKSYAKGNKFANETTIFFKSVDSIHSIS